MPSVNRLLLLAPWAPHIVDISTKIPHGKPQALRKGISQSNPVLWASIKGLVIWVVQCFARERDGDGILQKAVNLTVLTSGMQKARTRGTEPRRAHTPNEQLCHCM